MTPKTASTSPSVPLTRQFAMVVRKPHVRFLTLLTLWATGLLAGVALAVFTRGA